MVTAGQNGWVSAYSGTQTIATAGVNTISSTLTIIIPASSTYGFAISSTSLSYMTLTAGAGVNTFGTGGVYIKTGDNISWGGAVFPATPVNYPRGFHGCISWIPYGPCIDPPTAGTASTATPSICSGQSAVLTMTGGTGGAGQTYQWKSSATSGGPYTNVGPASSSSTYSASPTVPTYYVCEVTCGVGTATSNEISVNVPTPFPGGNYTINNALPTGGTNFNSFTAAVSAISCGISGPVVFDVDPVSGPYNEQISLPATIGSNATNTVTFNGNGRTIYFNSTNSAARHIIKLDGADYITFNDLVVDGSAAAATYAWGFHLTNGADYNTISLCNIKVSKTNTTSVNHQPIAFTNSTTSTTTAGNNGSYNTIIDNTLEGGYYGITLCGSAVSAENLGNTISNNTIRDFYSYGIYMLYQRQASVIGCDISRPTRTTSTTTAGVFQTTGAYGNDIENNRVHNMFDAMTTNTSTMYGFYLATAGTALEPNKIINNLIYDIKANGAIYGHYNTTGGNTKFQHNTFSFDNAAATAGLVYGIYQTGSTTGLDFKNNVITIARGGTGAKVGLYYSTSASTFSSNNNVVFLNSAGTGTQNFGNWNGTNYATKALFNTASTQDANSVQTNPLYTNPASPIYDFKPTSILTNNIGANVGVAFDIVGSPRLLVSPDPGCYEYALAGLDAGITWVSPTSPTTAGLKTITVNLTNNLSTTINSVTLAYTTIGGTPVTETFTGLSFLPSTAQNFSFTTQYNLTSTTAMRAYIVDVNGITDNAQANDTTTIQNICLSLLGNYTINSAVTTGGTNFQTFGAFATALSCGGVAGPVTVDVVSGSGPYNEQVAFGAYPGASVSNNVTINGNGNTLSFSGVTEYHTLRMNGADFMTWNNLIVSATNATNGIALLMSNASDNNTFLNCQFLVNQAITSSTSSAVAFSSSTTSPTGTGNNGNSNTFSGCTMSGGYYCVSVY
ncbi:MAG TPA: right-handed parallel beta-helix repeat-containing protein, partial [Chitinophagaceae bacterium]|nr:right-handed parallel beta-helix repeat-containing protein [Chitinophagaceae bacterium]